MSKDIPPNPRALALRREKRQIVFSSDLRKTYVYWLSQSRFRGEDTKNHEIWITVGFIHQVDLTGGAPNWQNTKLKLK